MASQYLADSSLSEDVSQYDFSTPIQVNYLEKISSFHDLQVNPIFSMTISVCLVLLNMLPHSQMQTRFRAKQK